jgi:hypothetical protein
MTDAERNIRLIELGYDAGRQGLDIDAIRQEILKIHRQ